MRTKSARYKMRYYRYRKRIILINLTNYSEYCLKNIDNFNRFVELCAIIEGTSIVSWKDLRSLTRGPFFLLQVSALHIVKLSHTVGKSWLFPPWKLPRFIRDTIPSFSIGKASRAFTPVGIFANAILSGRERVTDTLVSPGIYVGTVLQSYYSRTQDTRAFRIIYIFRSIRLCLSICKFETALWKCSLSRATLFTISY